MLVITARDSVADRVMGLDAGADDYLVKPFDLLSCRRVSSPAAAAGRAFVAGAFEHGQLLLNPATHEVMLGGAPVNLSSVNSLSCTLFEQPGVRAPASATRGAPLRLG